MTTFHAFVVLVLYQHCNLLVYRTVLSGLMPLCGAYRLVRISELTRCVMKHKCPRTRQIPEVAIIVKTQGQDFKIYGSNVKVLSQVTCI
jgi:hypothetical protein